MKRNNRINKYFKIINETYEVIAMFTKIDIIFLLEKIKYYKARLCCLIERNINERNELIKEYD